MILHTKYQNSGPSGFRQEDFLCFPNIGLCKSCDPPGWGLFGPRDKIWKKNGRGPINDATYEISRL